MKQTSLRILSLLLCISILLPLSACKKSAPPNDKDVPAVSTPGEPLALDGKCRIVRGEFYIKSAEIALAMQYVKNAVAAVFGEAPDLCDDKENTNDANAVEILIGDTDRKQSKDALADLGVNDYTYTVSSQNTVVICGGSAAATLEGAKKFCLDLLGYDAISNKVVSADTFPTVGASFTHKDNYPYENATVGGIDINQVTVAVTSSKYISYAYKAAMIFAKYTGTVMPIVTYDDLKGDEACVICVGAADRAGRPRMKKNHSGYLLRNSVKSGLLSIGVAVSDEQFYDEALAALEQNITVSEGSNGVSISLFEDDVLGFDNTYDVPNWYLSSEKSESVADGVTYVEQTYVDDDGLPYVVYVLTVDPAKASLEMGTSDNGYKYTVVSDKRQTTEDHMKAAIKNGMNVIAGVNADFFDIDGDYHPRGLTIKNGTLISKGEMGRPYFAFTSDGKAVIGTSGTTAKTDGIVTAVGGSHIIVENGIPKDLDMDDTFGYTSHPRTLAGIREDGTIVFAVVDGRQPEISNGAPLARCAYLMISLGATTAINLDGGGSSTMIVCDGDSYDTKNSPSDGTLRKIYNSVLIVGK